MKESTIKGFWYIEELYLLKPGDSYSYASLKIDENLISFGKYNLNNILPFHLRQYSNEKLRDLNKEINDYIIRKTGKTPDDLVESAKKIYESIEKEEKDYTYFNISEYQDNIGRNIKGMFGFFFGILNFYAISKSFTIPEYSLGDFPNFIISTLGTIGIGYGLYYLLEGKSLWKTRMINRKLKKILKEENISFKRIEEFSNLPPYLVIRV